MDEDWKIQAERRINTMETRTAVDEVHRKVVESRLGRIEDNLRWLLRAVVGSVIAALMAFLLKGGFLV